ncbi:putative low complexity [Cryptosporidium bovis]|uniref:putative low complexity n=1 Tax=Cryptosporidium bovis TaxID=310047 RepID=UPI003519D986|nr:putative low complexity [Cryptosporidium bovis]
MNWFEKLTYKLIKGEINDDSKVDDLIKEECKSAIVWVDKENKCLENDSIFNQIYELNGCYRCNLKIPGFGFGNYLCDIMLMENELAVFHLINRNNLNIQCIIAPIAATAFAKTTVNDENMNDRIISRGEWVILPFNHILDMKLIENDNLNIKTKSGINYIIGDNIECVNKMLKIHENNIKHENKSTNSENNHSILNNNENNEFKITNAKIPISNLDIATQSINEISPYSNQYPCCIVSISNIKLAEIITSDLFYGKYILDPQETFNLVISEWNNNSEDNDLDIYNNKDIRSFILKSGSNRDIQYKKKIKTGLVDIWISFKEKHQLLYPLDLSYIHLLINVNFDIFEKEINLKLLVRILSLNENQSQMDIECELENISELPYLIRYQFENTTLNSIKATVDRYIDGIKNQMINTCNSNNTNNINSSCVNENFLLEKITDCGTSCGIEFGANNNNENMSCNNSICCFVHFERLFNKLVNNC